MKIRIPFMSKKEITDKRPLSHGSWQNIFMNTGYSGRADVASLYYAYNNVVDIKASVRKIADATAKAGYFLEDKAGEEVVGQELAKVEGIFYKGGFNMFVRNYIQDLCVAGNMYWLLLKNVDGATVGIQRLDPRMMYVKITKYGEIIGYEQRNNTGDVIEYDKDEIIHKYMDSSTYNEMLGMSPIEVIITEAKTEIKSNEASLYLYENNAVPSHLLIVEEDLDDDQYARLSKDMKQNYGGVKNKFKSGMIPHIKDIKTITPSHKDLDYVATKMLNVQKIVAALGVDKFLLGYTDGVQRGNSEEIKQAFYEDTVKAYELLFEETMNSHILPDLGVSSKFRIRESNYKNNSVEYARTLSDVLAGVMTINEARQMRGLDESDNKLASELLFSGVVLDDLQFEQTESLKEAKAAIEKKEKVVRNLLN